MTNCCPRPPMQWSGAIGVIARCKRASTVCAPKSRSRRALRSICGEKPKAKGVTRPFKPYIRRVQDESNPVSSLQSLKLPINIPTVSLGVTSVVVSSCEHDSGHIEHRVAHEFAVHVATQRGLAERPYHRHPPCAQPVAPMRECHGRRPRLPPRRCTAQAAHRDQG